MLKDFTIIQFIYYKSNYANNVIAKLVLKLLAKFLKKLNLFRIAILLKCYLL